MFRRDNFTINFFGGAFSAYLSYAFFQNCSSNQGMPSLFAAVDVLYPPEKKLLGLLYLGIPGK